MSMFFENAGGSQVPHQVIDKVASSLSCRHRCVVGSQTVLEARRLLGILLGAHPDHHDVFMGANATSLLDRLAHKFVESGQLRSDDEIVICTENHVANVTPWIWAAQSVGATIKWLQTNDEHELKKLITAKTRVLCASHASNVLGLVRDLRKICQSAKKLSCGRAVVVADGVAAAPHVSPSVSDSQVDWYVISCHKLFGPHIGALCGRAEAVQELSPPENVYKWLEMGTINYEACAGVQGLAEYFQTLATFSGETLSESMQTRNQCTESKRDRHEGSVPPLPPDCNEMTTTNLNEAHVLEAFRRIRLVEEPLVELLHKRLSSCDKVRIVESCTAKTTAKLPVFSFVHQVIPSSDIVAACRESGIVCRCGTFLSTAALQDAYNFADDGVVRVSLSHYNTVSEVGYLMEHLESLANWW